MSEDYSEELRVRTIEAVDQHMRECDRTDDDSCKILLAKILAHWATKHPEKGLQLLRDGGAPI